MTGTTMSDPTSTCASGACCPTMATIRWDGVPTAANGLPAFAGQSVGRDEVGKAATVQRHGIASVFARVLVLRRDRTTVPVSPTLPPCRLCGVSRSLTRSPNPNLMTHGPSSGIGT